MRVIKIDKIRFDKFIAKQNLSQFLQSWQWSKFQEGLGQSIWRIGIEDDSEVVASVFLIKKQLGRFNYFYSPRGPIIGGQTDLTKTFNFLIDHVKHLAKKENVKFWRFEPTFALPVNHWSLAKTIDLQPPHTLVLDLKQSEEELLKAMHQKTRYNIRLAKKKGVEVSKLVDEDWSEVWHIFKQTKKRDRFGLHDQKYYQAMLNQGMITGWVARYKGKIISASIVCSFGDTVTYVHGASSNQHRNVMAPYLLQWQAILMAKEEGYNYYDFFGIDEKKWPGVTKFKQGFGGQAVSYLGTYDLIFSRLYYNVYKILRKIRRIF